MKDDVNNEQSGVPPDEKKESKKNATLKAFAHLVIKLAVVALLISLALIFVFGVFRLGGNNMYPALKDGDLCVTYKLEEYHSSDVVAYRIDGHIRFGRVVARAGDTIDGDEQGLLINGSHPHEEVFYPTQITDTVLKLPYTLGEGEFVVLNDYRTDLDDSRTYGIIKKDALKGKVIFIFRRRGF
ncbi:MAG: signal peptidase I [Oscillospiraceae bacterium]|nr:signal peptidase I [Oscillospiraceae bacterium]